MFKKGFTLIELLVTIAVIAVIAAAVLVALDPVDKINAANDSRVQADLGQVGTALVTYATSHDGLYLAGTAWGDLSALTASGDLTRVPTAPSTVYTYGFTGTTASARVWSNLMSKKYTAAPFWVWCSSSGAANTASAATACPP